MRDINEKFEAMLDRIDPEKEKELETIKVEEIKA